NARCDQDQPAAAVEAYQNAVRLQPDLAEAHYHLGRTLARLGRTEEATSAFRRTTALQSRHAAAHRQLGVTLAARGLLGDAAEPCRKAVYCDPKLLQAYENLGNVWNMLGRRAEAQDVWRRWLEQAPESPVARHMLAAMSGEGVPARAADAFVREVFDSFA